MPLTHGHSYIHISEIAAIVESDGPVIELAPPFGGPVEEAIGRNIAGLVADGSCLQLGIGGIPDAVLLFLHDKNDLGIHSEMFSEGVVDLYHEGVITNRNKAINRDKIVASFLMGTRRLYDFVDDNPAVNMFPVNITNDPYLIGQNDRVVAINSALQVALLLTPVLVFASFAFATPLTLVFPALLAVALLMAAGIGALVVYDGESTWEEGAILIGLYVVIAASFWWGT